MKNHGFTLLELIITIALAAILLGLAVPNLRDFIQNNRMAGQANEIVTALNLARSEALKRSRSVDFCASTDGTSCDSASVDWSGSLIVTDPNLTPAELVRIFDDPLDSILVEKTPDNDDVIRYLNNGMLDTNAVTLATSAPCSDAVCFELCERDTADEETCAAPRCRAGRELGARRIVVSRTGNASVEPIACP